MKTAGSTGMAVLCYRLRGVSHPQNAIILVSKGVGIPDHKTANFCMSLWKVGIQLVTCFLDLKPEMVALFQDTRYVRPITTNSNYDAGYSI